MAAHYSTLAWEIPWTEKPSRLQSMESWRVRHDWATSLSLFTFMHWRRKWQPTPVFLLGESQGREPGGLQTIGSQRVGHDWSDLAAAAAAVEPGSETIGRLSKKTQILDLDILFWKCMSSNGMNLSSRRNSIPWLSKCKGKPIYVFPLV